MPGYSRGDQNRGTRCTTEGARGTFCDADSLPDAPFPICKRHAIELFRWMQDMVTEVQTNHRQHLAIHEAAVDQVVAANHARLNTRQHQIYYVRVGDRIKIGMTSQLTKRLAAYPPGSELLATEPGGEDVETERLRQFRHLLADRKEWFHPGEDLLAHIASLTRPA
jgi:hypothetical protein